MAGSVHWLESWAVSDPGALVQRYANLFVAKGGQILHGDANTLGQHSTNWHVQTDAGDVTASQIVIALGPWANAFVKKLGYDMPLFIKRGYHQHYKRPTRLSMPLLDYEKGYVIAPMQQGMRLTTGAEFARIDAPATPIQLQKTQSLARQTCCRSWVQLPSTKACGSTLGTVTRVLRTDPFQADCWLK